MSTPAAASSSSTAVMDTTGRLLAAAHDVYARQANTTAAATTDPATVERPPVYKVIGISLAIGSGAFIGTSFVLKKVGLLRANEKYKEVAGEGYGYLKNAYWWGGMTLMIVGEICNFVAYAFTDAILVTPLGALSVVITTVLSAFFLKERLSMVGKVACFLCIVGSVVIVMNAPQESSVANIQQMQHFVIAPGFLTYAGLILIGSVFAAFWAGPRWGKKNMLVYLSICSWIGGLSVVATQGLGSAIVAQAGGQSQFNQWFLYVLLIFVVGTLLTEIIFLNVSGLHLPAPPAPSSANSSASPVPESSEPLQCRHGHADLLRLLHQHHHHHVGRPLPGLQGLGHVYRHSRERLPDHLLWRGAAAAVQVGQGRARRRPLRRRSRPDPDHRRAGAARVRAQG